MAGNQVSQRAVAAVLGGLVADSAALPLHWIYDVKKLDDAVGDRPDPEFLPKSHCPFYTIQTGCNSCYGDQMFVVLESLTESKGFDIEDYKKRLYAKFGPETEYEGKVEAKKGSPVPYPWRNKGIKNFLANYKEGRHEALTNDTSSDSMTKVAPIVALYAGRPEMESMVRDIVKVTQDNAMAIESAVACALILEKYILSGPSAGTVESLVEKMPSGVMEQVKEAIAVKGMKNRDAVQKFGSHCGNPNALQGCIHSLVTSKGDFVATVRENMLAGGDNCGRLGFIGAAMGAQAGLEGIPKDWISRTNCGSNALQLAERLVKLRPA